MRYLLLVALAAFFIAEGARDVRAQTVQSKCDLRAHIIAELGGGYGEQVVARGLGMDNAVLEILSSKKGGWSLVRTQLLASGAKLSCIIYAGKAWELMMPKKGRVL